MTSGEVRTAVSRKTCMYNKAISVLAFNKSVLATAGIIIFLIETFMDFLIQTNTLKTTYCSIDKKIWRQKQVKLTRITTEITVITNLDFIKWSFKSTKLIAPNSVILFAFNLNVSLLYALENTWPACGLCSGLLLKGDPDSLCTGSMHLTCFQLAMTCRDRKACYQGGKVFRHCCSRLGLGVWTLVNLECSLLLS